MIPSEKCTSPGPDAENYSQTITDLLSYLTVGFIFLSSSCSFDLGLSSKPNKLNLLSSGNIARPSKMKNPLIQDPYICRRDYKMV